MSRNDAMTDTAGKSWRPVPGFPAYVVSPLGQIKKLVGSRRLAAGRRVQPWCGGRHRTWYVDVWCRRHRRTLSLAPLLLRVFVGPPPPGHLAHWSGDRSGPPKLSELHWCLRGLHRRHWLHRSGVTGVRNGAAKLTPEQVREIHTLAALRVFRQDALGRRYGVSEKSISNVVCGRTWRALRPLSAREEMHLIDPRPRGEC